MLTHAQLFALDRSLRSEHVLSVYVHGAVDDPAARLVWRRELDQSLKDLRRWLAGSSHDEREGFGRCVTLLEERLAPFAAGIPVPGWAAFITPTGVRHTDAMPVPVPTMAVWSTGMCMSPYIRALTSTNPVIVVLVDARETRIHRYRLGDDLEHLETIHAHATVGAPLHMGDAPRQGFHVGVRGETGRDAVQRAHAVGTERMLKRAEAAVIRYAGRDGVVLVGGPAAVCPHFIAAIAEQLPDRVFELPSCDHRASHGEILSAAQRGASALRAEQDRRRVAQLVDGAGASGRAALGPAATRQALEQACVRELYLTSRYVDDHTAEAEDAVRRALNQRAALQTVTGDAAEELDRHGGLAARLRYRAPMSTREAGTSDTNVAFAAERRAP